MMKKKRYKMSSDAMEAAEIKNRAEECRRNAMDKIELRHHRNNLHGAEIIRKEAVKHLDKIHDICPVTYEELKSHHKNQYKKRYKAYIHIVNCYLARQEENKETWRRMRVTKEQRKPSFAREKVNTKERLELCKNYLEDIPVKADDHITFIAKAFPEFFMLEDPQMTLERDWSGDLLLTSNIYSGARAAHDRKCMSTRVQPISVGKYPRRNPINFKNVTPGYDWPPELTSKEPSLLEPKDKLPPIGTPFTLTTSASPHVGGFSKLHKRNKKNKVRRVSMMSQTGTSAARQLHFKLPKINL